jgi:hypothetical protein
MNGLVAAPLQFCADRRFAGAGNALDKIISFAHKTIHYFAGGIGVKLLVAPPTGSLEIVLWLTV